MTDGWIAVDLDGTLAMYDRWRGIHYIGDPVPTMLERVKDAIRLGFEVRIFTARVAHDGTLRRHAEAEVSERCIKAWCVKHIGKELAVTCQKDFGMIECWDDRSVAVEANTGRFLNPSKIMVN